jgi:TonB family protein
MNLSSMLFKTRMIIGVCVAWLCVSASARQQQAADSGSAVPPQIHSAKTALSDFEVKISEGEFQVRRKGTSKWQRSSKLNEPITVGLLDGTQKVSLGTKAVKPPKAIHVDEPRYPENERESRQQGQVSLHVVVDDHGMVRFPVVDASPGPEFTNAAIEAVKKWTFNPAKLNGQPVAVLITVTTEFRLY